MGPFFLFLFLFFAAKALLSFWRGRIVAASFSVLACMLFAGGLYVDFARQSGVAVSASKPTA